MQLVWLAMRLAQLLLVSGGGGATLPYAINHEVHKGHWGMTLRHGMQCVIDYPAAWAGVVASRLLCDCIDVVVSDVVALLRARCQGVPMLQQCSCLCPLLHFWLLQITASCLRTCRTSKLTLRRIQGLCNQCR